MNNKKIKFLLVAILLGGLIYVNRAEIRNFINKFPCFRDNTNTSDFVTKENRGSYETYYSSPKNNENLSDDDISWRMKSNIN